MLEGVAANKALRTAIKDLESSLGIKVFYPSLKYCGDNAAMIAFVGSLRSSDKIEPLRPLTLGQGGL